MEIRVSNLRPVHARAGTAKVLAEFDADVGPVRFRRMRLARDLSSGPSILMPEAVTRASVSVIDGAAKEMIRQEAWRQFKEQRQ
ncbi:hypothetical protein J2X65_003820 [Ancylobacter sp. 3268]|uniref:hypothetical protein n=1 Tax=Ancylobacter sp. 3268 TaxID=2817752 RepID=UPI00285F4B71|nr:hypothetical protein [Ancylobacter sp. 3268]MDR6954450.1 hypothetical protein [Ancylobacter sp. 3268]